MRYYDKKLRCEVFEANENTLTNEDERVSFFFEELPQGKQVEFTEDGIPYLEDIQAIPQEKLDLLNKISEYQYLLDSTDYKFTDDYDLKDTSEWLELKIKRQEAREFIRANK